MRMPRPSSMEAHLPTILPLPLLLSSLLLALAEPVAVTASPAPSPTPHAMVLPLQPGQMVGTVQSYVTKAGEDLEHIAFTHGVAVNHVLQPSKGLLHKGVHKGLHLFIDQRRIEPGFSAEISGIVLNLPEAEVYFLDAGRIVKSYPVGVSVGEAEWRAPVGESKVVAMDKDPIWHIPKKIQVERARKGLTFKTEVAAGPKNPLGNRWIGFADGTFGFHGTLDPGSIKQYESHGCVRFLRPHIEDLYGRVKIGTPVHVTYQPVILASSLGTVWLTAFPDFYHRGFDYRAAVKALVAKTSGGAPMLNWQEVEKVLKAKDGLVHDVGVRPNGPDTAPGPSPSVVATPSPTTTAAPIHRE